MKEEQKLLFAEPLKDLTDDDTHKRQILHALKLFLLFISALYGAIYCIKNFTNP